MSNPKAPAKLDDYSDIINLPRPISKTHPRMDKKSRAAQFAPYAALVGHRDIIASEEQIAFTKNDIGHEVITELDPEIDEGLKDNIDSDFSQEDSLSY